jgi:hypothetical protein
VRLQDQGKVIGPAQFTPRRWLMHLARRLGLLADLYGQPLGLDFPQLAACADAVTLAKNTGRAGREKRTRWAA